MQCRRRIPQLFALERGKRLDWFILRPSSVFISGMWAGSYQLHHRVIWPRCTEMHEIISDWERAAAKSNKYFPRSQLSLSSDHRCAEIVQGTWCPTHIWLFIDISLRLYNIYLIVPKTFIFTVSISTKYSLNKWITGHRYFFVSCISYQGVNMSAMLLMEYLTVAAL